VNFSIDDLVSYVPQIESGKMRALAVTSAQRWPTLPNVPTMAEAGIKDFVVTSWAAFVVPAGTPRPVTDALSAAMRKIAADEALQKRFRQGRVKSPRRTWMAGRRGVRASRTCANGWPDGPVAQQDRAAVS
jgi:tripartite-type tricarboxylate transporter receptor subunit TctC